MKEQILKLIELKPNIGYNELSMTFGLPLKGLLELLDITNYEIKDKYIHIYDSNGNIIYEESSNSGWVKYEYDNNGNITYKEDSDGFWVKREYDDNGNKVYEEHSDGYWSKYEYDKNNNITYRENSDGYKFNLN